MFKKAVVGGTFDRMHAGHQKIITTAFGVARSVAIGLTSDEFANRFRSSQTTPYGRRKQAVEEYAKTFGKPYNVVEISDSYGVATIDPDIDCIIVSEETLLRAEEINAIRFKKQIPKLTIVVIPILLAQDGGPISSERILKKEIDAGGKLVRK
ncbi:MAG: pantetheine-phosphate adenylyltransferase [Candidatus Altiarchaeota archaeon]|nr:pantetheine-phosphate adenylyltransferase [Candidatus Altiarchaeota archaeon]